MNSDCVCLDREFLPGASAFKSDLCECGHTDMDGIPFLYEA